MRIYRCWYPNPGGCKNLLISENYFSQIRTTPSPPRATKQEHRWINHSYPSERILKAKEGMENERKRKSFLLVSAGTMKIQPASFVFISKWRNFPDEILKLKEIFIVNLFVFFFSKWMPALPPPTFPIGNKKSVGKNSAALDKNYSDKNYWSSSSRSERREERKTAEDWWR